MHSNLSLLLLVSYISILTGCTTGTEEQVVTISEITPEEILRLEPDADIFQYNDVIYQTNIDWVDELELTTGKRVMTIEENASDPEGFSHGTANLLPIGTDIFEADGRHDVLIADVDDEYLYYMAIVEG
ncbi:hypothetical protein [Alkalibacterium olivapovliticus]|uniref:Uncharacterized protein n=1 Tax=Alkalibacterium olivapovliticus TaxID=99907 RepID=A0A2T0W901_9LACT|nr:hypothetical protein [Alkalibacterium olivapovliticus]PRY83192.1 hypothetical protein CLV38_10697 [Alkalibacterium olivapovliticus]